MNIPTKENYPDKNIPFLYRQQILPALSHFPPFILITVNITGDYRNLQKSFSMAYDFLESAIKQFEYYKQLGEKSFEQVSDEQLFWQYNEDSNSIATIVKHLWGNMMSRWTDFLTTDGEKEWRQRDAEFINDIKTREEMMKLWEEGWTCLFNVLRSLQEDDLGKIVYIRNMGQTVTEAINRQLAHYPYHVGQIVYIARMAAKDWNSLSIPRGQSTDYNKDKFAQAKRRQHFTDEYLGNNKEIES